MKQSKVRHDKLLTKTYRFPSGSLRSNIIENSNDNIRDTLFNYNDKLTIFHMYNQIVIVRLFSIVLIYLKLNALCQGAISLIVPRLGT